MKFSLNNTLILKPYTKTRELQSTQVATGFSMTVQKIGIESLELLVDSSLNLGHTQLGIEKGTKVFFKESVLYTQPWAREVFKSEEFPDGFVIANSSDILYLSTEGEDETI